MSELRENPINPAGYICSFWGTCATKDCRHRRLHEGRIFGQLASPACANCRPATEEEIEQMEEV